MGKLHGQENIRRNFCFDMQVLPKTYAANVPGN